MRLSVTDLCNLRCIYCMPQDGIEKLRHADILSVEEIDAIVRAAASLGIRKIRLTGGEPLVRRGIETIVRNAAATPGIEEVCLTTNGILLADRAAELKAAGVDRVNISIDSLDAVAYAQITRGGKVEDALAGIRAALEAGFAPIKVNAVLIGGVNDREIGSLVALTEKEDIHLRFIEIMPIGECAGWNNARFIGADAVLAAEPSLVPAGTDGVSRLFRKPGHVGTVGLISPISNHFCPGCNKIRVTSDGKLKPCLHSGEEIALRGLAGDALQEALSSGMFGKPLKHTLEGGGISNSERNMNAIGG
jgi:cyclic pyranopterin phosphate synthase